MVSSFRNWRLALISAFVLGTLPTWAQEAPSSAVPELEDTQQLHPSDAIPALSAELFYDLLVGEMAASQGDAANALALLMEAARESQSPQLYLRAAEIALQSRSGQQALMVANEWQKNSPESRDANRYLLQVLLMLNRTSESQEPLSREMAWTHPASKPAAYLSIPQLYSRVTDKALAASVVEQALQPDLQNTDLAPAAWATIGLMRMAAKQNDLALQALLHAHSLDPSSPSTALLALELMEAGNASAESMAQDYLQHQPAPSIQMTYVRLLMVQSRWKDAQKQLTDLLKTSPDMTDAWMIQADLYAQQGDWKAAQKALVRVESLLQAMPQHTRSEEALSQVYVLGAQISLQQKNYDQALIWLEKIPNASDSLRVQSLKALAVSKQGKLALGRALIRAVPAKDKEQGMKKRQAEVSLLRENGAFQEAYLLQYTLYEQLPDDANVAYETALLAERAGKLSTMEKILRDIIAKNPSHHHAANALGYSYADRGIRLIEAKALIEKALQQAPNDPFITDSLGWVEFRMGNTSKALELLEKAYALRADVEIATHLGEVLWSMGKKDQALKIWREAAQQDPNNESLRSTLDRLQAQP